MHTEAISGYRLSPSQSRAWAFAQEAGSFVPSVQAVVLIEGGLNVSALGRALDHVVQRHSILRTTFEHFPGMTAPLQVVAEKALVFLRSVDLVGMTNTDRAETVEARVSAQRDQKLDLKQSSLLQVELIREAPESHLMLLRLPALCSDSNGLRALAEEISSAYAAIVNGNEAEGEPIEFAAVADWLNDLRESEESKAGRAYWQTRMADRLSDFKLPFESPVRRGAFACRILPREVPPAIHERLTALAQDGHASVSTLLLACWQYLVIRLSGQSDATVWVTCDGRPDEEMRRIVGCLETCVPLTVSGSERWSIREWLAKAAESVADAQVWQEYFPVRTAADPGQNEGPSYCWAFSDTPRAFHAGGIRFTLRNEFACGEKFKVKLHCRNQGSSLLLEFYHDTSWFAVEDAERLAECFLTLLGAVCQNPGSPCAELEVVGARERKQLLSDFNDTREEFPPSETLQEWFEDQVARTPDAVALVCNGERMTFAALNQKANTLAHYLRSLGVGADALVGLHLARSMEMVTAMLATLKAGGAYVPLDPDYPKDRLKLILEDAAIPVVLTQTDVREALPDAPSVRCVVLDKLWESLAAQPDSDPPRVSGPENLAYVIYTSGSTGLPKGVMISHSAICNHMHWMQGRFPLEPNDRVLQKTVFSFDASVWEFFAPLLNGGQLVLAEPGTHRDTHKLADVLVREQITILQLVPSQLQVLLEEPRLKECTALRRVFCGGEPLVPQLRDRFHSVLNCALFNLYGPTEATIDATWAAVGPRDVEDAVSIGKPISNTQVLVLDSNLHLVPRGAAGELCIGGGGLARGYLNRAELTAERFVPNPFSTAPDQRLYRTGDLAVLRSDGSASFVGRIDHQVKLRGYRIELGEIEAALNSHGQVRQAIVTVDDEGEKRLVAYVVPGAGDRPATEELRAYLSARLPEYMVPACWMFLDRFPLTLSGKVDRKALPRPAAARTDDGDSPRTPIEELMAGIWARMLRLNAVGPKTDFFRSGGHSLAATQLISRVREVFGVELSLASLFENPLLADFVHQVEVARQNGQAQEIPPIQRHRRDQALPLSYSQERLWFLDQLNPGNVAYNVPSRMRIFGKLDRQRLVRAINEIVERHEVLRTTFEMREGRPVQVIHPRQLVDVVPITLEDLPEPERQKELSRLAMEEAARPFDLVRGPLFRVAVVVLAEEEHAILFTLHHIVSDGWSAGVLFKEFVQLYNAYGKGEPSCLPELPVQYADYALWQREWLQGEVLDRQLQYWREQLRDVPPLLELPTDRPRPLVPSHRGATHRVLLDQELTNALRELSQREGVTLFMTLSAAFKALLQKYTGREDIVVGTPVAGRNRGEIEPLIGCFLNTLVLRTDLSADPLFVDLMKREREVALGAYTHQDMPFEQLVQSFQLERSLSYNPLFQVMFVLNTAVPGEDLQVSGLRFQSWGLEHQTTKFDQSLLLEETANGLRGTLDYSTDLFDASTIARMARHWERLLAAAVAQRDRRLSELEILSQAERDELLAIGQRTRTAGARGALVHELFEQHAARNPKAECVASDVHRLNYGELNARANRLAHKLRMLGVGPEVPVGLCVERGVDMVVGVMAVMKAGGAYVPLDPAYPLERLAFMLADSQITVLLTQSHLEDRLPSHEGIVLYVDQPESAGEVHSADNPRTNVDEANLAYVIYTSGSTGRPKGVEVSHNALLNLVNWHNRAYDVGVVDRASQLASMGFDASVWELWPYLAAGASVHVCGDDIRQSLPSLIDWLVAQKITIAFLPTPMAELALSADWTAAVSLRAMLTGGDKLGQGAPEFFPFAFLNHYGPTENAVVATAGPAKNLELEQRAPPLGSPIDNTQVYILSRWMEIVPLAVPGEIYIGGESLARGYFGRPDWTAERFVPDSISGEPGRRLYRTGDRARRLHDGAIEYLGRVDQQVKIRGFRIELGEIEAVVRECPGVRASVLTVVDSGLDKKLVCYYAGDKDVGAGVVRDFLKPKVPDFMIPSAFAFCGEFPVTANGKIDRTRLPEVRFDRCADDGSLVAPRNEVEQWLVNLWKDLLKQDNVGVSDSFFELGGHSLLATQVISDIRDAYGVEMSMRSFFEKPTIEALAALMEQDFLQAVESMSEQEAQGAAATRAIDEIQGRVA